METLILTTEDVKTYTEMGDIIDAVEDAFAAYAKGNAQMPTKAYVDLPQYNGDFRSMPAYVDAEGWEAVGVKWVNVHPVNPVQNDLPTVMGIVIYSDPKTGIPLAVIDGTLLTMKRTGAAAAVATQYLAIENASTMGLIGAGSQAYTQLEAISRVRPIEEVIVSDPDDDAIEAFVGEFGDRFEVLRGSLTEAAACDVLSTVTPVRDPIITADMVGKRTHVNAIGADAAGKQELSTEILLNAKLVIDDHAQTTHSGEINVPYRAGELTDDDIYSELGAVVIGAKSGRTGPDRVTVFDSTGLAIQDIASAHVLYERAIEFDVGTSLGLLPLD